MPPPVQLTAGELFGKLCETPRPSTVVDFPRKDPVTGKAVAKMRIVALTMSDQDEARLRAKDAIQERVRDRDDLAIKIVEEIVGDLTARFILMKCCRWVKPVQGRENQADGTQYPYVFADLADFDKAQITADELAVLFTMWEKFQHDCGPMYDEVADENELNAWIVRLAQGASDHPLSRISLPQLADLTVLLARRAYSLSAILESHSETLPPSLAARLESWGIGTYFSGALPAIAAEIGLIWSSAGESEDGEKLPRKVVAAEDWLDIDLGKEAVTPDEAAKLARQLLGRETTVGAALPRDDDSELP
jgi:hypothetical protein